MSTADVDKYIRLTCQWLTLTSIAAKSVNGWALPVLVSVNWYQHGAPYLSTSTVDRLDSHTGQRNVDRLGDHTCQRQPLKGWEATLVKANRGQVGR